MNMPSLLQANGTNADAEGLLYHQHVSAAAQACGCHGGYRG